MTSLRQVVHVMAKDLRHHWGIAVLYIICVAIGTWDAKLTGGSAFNSLGWLAVLVLLAGIVLVGSAVRSDSPTDATAFWGSRNFSPLAMAGAKFGLALLVLAVALFGQFMALRAFHMVGWDAVAPLGDSALQFGAAMLAVMCLAAIAKGESTWGTLMLFLFGLYVLPTVLGVIVGHDTVARLATRPLMLLSAVLVGALIIWMYRTRDMRMSTRRIGVALVAITVLVAGSKTNDRSSGALPDSVARPAFTLGDTPAERGTNRSTLQLSMVIPPLPSDLQFGLERPTVRVRLRDGSELHLETEQPKILLTTQTQGSPTPALPGIRASVPSDTVSRIVIAVRATEKQRTAMDAGIASATLDGRVTVTRALATGMIPLTDGKDLEIPGRRLWIDSVRFESGAPQLNVAMTSIARYSQDGEPTTANDWRDNATTFALINRSLGEMRSLSRLGGMTLPGAVLLPALPTATEHRRVGLRPGTGAPWMRSAELLVVTHVPLGSYALHLERPNARFALRTP